MDVKDWIMILLSILITVKTIHTEHNVPNHVDSWFLKTGNKCTTVADWSLLWKLALSGTTCQKRRGATVFLQMGSPERYCDGVRLCFRKYKSTSVLSSQSRTDRFWCSCRSTRNERSKISNDESSEKLNFRRNSFWWKLEFAGTADDVYAGTDYRAWKFRSSKAARKEHICIVLHTDQTETIEEWEQGLQTALQRIADRKSVV